MPAQHDNLTIDPQGQRIHFLTGRLAAPALDRVLAQLSPQAGFESTVQVLGITVAALLTVDWVLPRLEVPKGTQLVILPGYCRGDPAVISQRLGIPVLRGPKDLRELPNWFGQRPTPGDYGRWDIEILAEVNHCPRLTLAEILAQADRLRSAGANLIDVGCDPGETWSGVEETVRALRGEGHRVSIDSYNPQEIEPAVGAGAELVLSVNHTNRHAAVDWGVEVVVVPDEIQSLESCDETIALLSEAGVPLRIDPILEPIGFGFAASLGRYLAARQRWPDAELMMGIGNLSELTEVDSAGVNVLLLGFCQELGIRSVLTTEVINWARSSVRECDVARQLVHWAITERELPKHRDRRLVMLRDVKLMAPDEAELSRLAADIKDHNFRLFVSEEKLHAVNGEQHVSGEDPFEMFARMLTGGSRGIDPEHAFYLGYELAKAVTALTLSKNYVQDEALDWGLLTRAEQSHQERNRRKGAESPSDPAGDDPV